jgi:stage II sporulation protein D
MMLFTLSRPSRWARVLVLSALGLLLVGGCSCEPLRRHEAVPVAGKEVPVIRVLLGDENAPAMVAVTGAWTLVGPAGEIASGSNLEWTEIGANGGQVLFGLHQPPVAGTLELRAATDGTLWVHQTVGGKDRERSYRGVLHLVPTEAGTVRLINVLPLEMYVAGVLTNEMPRAWNLEAFKAQAVAARTYALAERNGRTLQDFDVRDSTMSQVYGGHATETATAWDAVAKTWGVVATYRGAGGKTFLLKTYFHSTCGGGTAPVGAVFGGATPAPLAGNVPCIYCGESPKFRWPEVALTKQEIGDALRKTGQPDLVRLGTIDRVEVASTIGGVANGRAELIRVVDTAGQSVLLRADYWRYLVSAGRLFSTWFDLEDAGNRILVKNGRGYGHGVGLCQWGAEYLAEHGKTGEEILRYYYPTVELFRAY